MNSLWIFLAQLSLIQSRSTVIVVSGFISNWYFHSSMSLVSTLQITVLWWYTMSYAVLLCCYCSLVCTWSVRPSIQESSLTSDQFFMDFFLFWDKAMVLWWITKGTDLQIIVGSHFSSLEACFLAHDNKKWEFPPNAYRIPVPTGPVSSLYIFTNSFDVCSWLRFFSIGLWLQCCQVFHFNKIFVGLLYSIRGNKPKEKIRLVARFWLLAAVLHEVDPLLWN